MIALFEGPLPPRSALAIAALVIVAGALYCSLYNFLQGTPESPLAGAAWAVTNLLTWLAAFELCKRINCDPAGTWAANWRTISLILAVTAFLSVSLDFVATPFTGQAPGTFGFELVRRIPSAFLVIVMLLAIPLLLPRLIGDPQARAEREPPSTTDSLPLLPQQIDWIKAAGNYLEFRSADTMILRRMTMARAENLLSREGFIRIHRSALVNGQRVVRVRRGKIVDEVKLADGTWLKVGGAYRPFVARLEPPPAS